MSVPPTVELDAQYRLLREGCGLLRRPRLRVLEVSGAEGAEFLQGQLTNDVEVLEPGGGCYALLLDRKGKIRAELDALRVADDQILIRTDEAVVDELFRHLDTYRIGREADVGRLDRLATLSLLGPQTAEILGTRLGAEHSHELVRIAETDVRAIATLDGADLLCPADELEAIAAELIAAGAEEVEPEAVEILRVEAGRPRLGAEMGHDTIPQEAGLNERAVSFDKGCYVGQETVARLHYKGKPNRHLRRLRSERPLETGAAVSVAGKQVGTVGTAVLSPARGPLALAILRREAEPGAEVVAGDVAARVEEIA